MTSIVRAIYSRDSAQRLSVLIVSIVAFAAGRCQAAIIITAPTITLPYSTAAQTGSFEVFVQSTGVSAPQVGAMNVELQAPIGSGVTFMLPADSTPTVHPYLFQPQSPISMVVDSGRTVEGTDFTFSPLPILADGDGLLLVKYQVAPGIIGNIPLTFAAYSKTTNPVGTALFDANNLPLSASLSDGSINVASPIPEPATWLLAVLAAMGFFARAAMPRTTNPKR
jgi:hypothetical protein